MCSTFQAKGHKSLNTNTVWFHHSCCLVAVMSDSFVSPWTVAHQAPQSFGFPRQEYWSEFPFASPGALPDTGMEPMFPALQADSLPLSHQGSLVSQLDDYKMGHHFIQTQIAVILICLLGADLILLKVHLTYAHRAVFQHQLPSSILFFPLQFMLPLVNSVLPTRLLSGVSQLP